MNKFRQLFLLCAVMVVVAMTGCSKDDDGNPAASGLLTSGAWHLASTVEDGEEFEVGEGFLTIRFKSDGTFTTAMAFEEEEYTGSGTWKLIKNDKYLLLEGEEVEIRKIDGSNLHLRDSEGYEMRFKK